MKLFLFKFFLFLAVFCLLAGESNNLHKSEFVSCILNTLEDSVSINFKKDFHAYTEPNDSEEAVFFAACFVQKIREAHPNFVMRVVITRSGEPMFKQLMQKQFSADNNGLIMHIKDAEKFGYTYNAERFQELIKLKRMYNQKNVPLYFIFETNDISLASSNSYDSLLYNKLKKESLIPLCALYKTTFLQKKHLFNELILKTQFPFQFKISREFLEFFLEVLTKREIVACIESFYKLSLFYKMNEKIFNYYLLNYAFPSGSPLRQEALRKLQR